MAGLIIYNSSTITDGCLALIGHFYTTIDTIHIEVGPIGAEFSLCVMRVANDNFRSCRARIPRNDENHISNRQLVIGLNSTHKESLLQTRNKLTVKFNHEQSSLFWCVSHLVIGRRGSNLEDDFNRDYL